MQCIALPRANGVLLIEELPDELLWRIFDERDDAEALGALIERYKPMVFRVCWRVLNHDQDAENATQRTFLVLMRKAKSIRKRTSLKCWLCSVASRMAKNVCKYRRRLQERERPKQIAQIVDGHEYHELQTLVDEGLQHLPEKIRICFILHCLEGKSKAETATELGLPEGTVASRAARGRVLMQKWLARHGITGP